MKVTSHDNQYPENETSGLECECCGKEAVGVCSTVVPYSTAFCEECIFHFAQPLPIIDFILITTNLDYNRLIEYHKDITAYIDGKYIPIKQYLEMNMEKLLELEEGFQTAYKQISEDDHILIIQPDKSDVDDTSQETSSQDIEGDFPI
jgi:hypothetical protein